MTRAEEYLFKAAELSQLAENSASTVLKDEYQQLAESYLRLAEQMEKKHEKVDEKPRPASS